MSDYTEQQRKLLRKAILLLKDSPGHCPTLGLCYWIAVADRPPPPRHWRDCSEAHAGLLAKIRRSLDNSLFLQNWLLWNGHISLKQMEAIYNGDVELCRKLKNTRIAWAEDMLKRLG